MMLLPSDVARLVLGYLQEEGLPSTSQTFIKESPNLKEYAEHGTEDGVIPACVFSLFGKNLATILNEYVATKAKETSHEVPVMMTSLWKKLDFTVNQIKCLQNSPAISANQRMRSRYGQQRALTQSPTGGALCSSVPEMGSVLSPIQTPHSVLGHSTPVGYAYTQTQTRPYIRGTHLQIQEGGRLVTMPKDSPVQILIPDQRLLPGPMSPGRRKWDSPRRMRGGSMNASSGVGRSSMSVSSLATEAPPEEAVSENFPYNKQLVIQNAREKFLGDRSLQEKLAENINKILASDPSPQTSKASCSTVEPDLRSIDEILGLQGELHMSDDAIHDILEQTESDPAFQALFELFDYSKTRTSEAEQGEGDVSSSPEESDSAGPPQSGDQATVHEDVPATPDPTPTTGSVTLVPEPKTKKTRKSATPSSLKTTALNSSGRDSRLENSRVRLLVSQDKRPAVSPSAVKQSDRGHEYSALNSSDTAAPMDVDEPLNAAPPPPPPPPPPADTSVLQHVFKRPRKDAAPTSTALRRTGAVLSTINAAAFAACRTTTAAADVNKVQGERRAPEAGEQTSVQARGKAGSAAALSPSLNSPPALIIAIPAPEEVSKTPPRTANPPCGGGNPQPAVAMSETSPKPASSAPPAATPVPFTAARGAPALLPGTSGKEALDPSKIVSLEIIISDEQEEASTGDAALNQAVSSISGDRIPTIFLSSPAKSPGKAFGGASGALTASQDETTRAVSDLQSSEVGKPGLVAAVLPGMSQAPPTYIIQLPFDAANHGAATSYILVTEAAAADTQAKQLSVPVGSQQRQLLPASPYTLATPPRSQTYSAGSALILQSPGQPVVLPVGVSVGQNSAGKIQTVSNKFVTMPSPVARKQPEPIKPQPSTVAFRQPTVPSIGGVAIQKVVLRKVVKPPSAEKSSQQNVQIGTRRVLSFDSGEPTTPVGKTTTPTTVSKTTTPPAASTPVQHKEKDKPKSAPRTRPAILCDKKPKRRIEPVRCSDQTPTGLVKQTEKTLTGLVKQTDKSPTDSAKQTDQTPTCSAKQTDKTPTGSAKQTDKTPTGSAKQTEKTQTGSAKQTEKTPTGSAKQTDKTLTGSAKQTDKTPTGSAKQTDKTPTGSAKQTDKTPTGSAKQTEKTPTGSAKQTDKTLTGSAKQTEKTLTGSAKQTEKTLTPQQPPQQKKSGRRTPRKQDHKSNDKRLQSERVIRVDTSQPVSSKKTGSGEGAKATDAKQNTSRHDNDDDDDDDGAKPKEPRSSRSPSSDYKLRSESKKEREDTSRKERGDTSRKERGDTSRKEREDTSRKELLEKSTARPREGRAEKKTTASSDESPHVTANKENEVKGSRPEPPQQPTASSVPKELNPPAVTTPAPQPKSGKTPSKAASKTSPLTKQAAAMFQDIHGLDPPSTPVKRASVCSPIDLPLPRTPRPGRVQEESMDCPRTPVRLRQGRDAEGTPRHLLPPATPELPTCSPASEAGSENSINMAAHTLMILSRAAIARTGSPLKDSLRQEEAGEKSPTTSKYTKKRKQPATPDSPPAKKVLKRSNSSGSKKKEKKQKKLLDSFPDDLDVDKFLSSLHYDE